MSRIKYILPLLGDFGHAFCTAALIGLATQMSFSLMFVAWTVLFAFILDFDNIVPLVRGHLSANKESPKDHRDGWHYPLLWTAVFVVVFLVYGLNVWTMSGAIAVLLHFINDSFGTGWGIQYFWPFTRVSYRLSAKQTNVAVDKDHPLVDAYTPEEKHVAIKSYGNPNWINDMYVHPSTTAKIEYAVFTLGACLILYWVLVS